MKIRNQIMLLWLSVIGVICFLFIIQQYRTQKSTLMLNEEKKLVYITQMLHAFLGETFHDTITDSISINREEYEYLTEKLDDFCVEMDLQYLWGIIKIRDGFYYTASGSNIKFVDKSVTPTFFSQAQDTTLYYSAIEKRIPIFSEFHNELGDGTLILVPYKDALGRSYILAASVSIDHIQKLLNETLLRSLFLGVSILVVAIVLSLYLSNTLASPIVEIARISKKIASGSLKNRIEIKGSSEIESLGESFNYMNSSLKRQFDKLNFLNSVIMKTAGTLEVRVVVEEVLSMLTAFFHSQCCSFYLVESSTDKITLSYHSAICTHNKHNCPNLSFHKFIAEETIQQDKLYINSALNLPKCQTTHEQMKEFIGIPLTSGKMKVGVIVIAFSHKDTILNEKYQTLETISKHIGLILHNMLLYRELKDELEQRRIVEEQLQKAVRQAVEANRTKSEFIANISHEIRTPLNSVIGFSEILSNTDINDKQREYIKSIKSGGKALLLLINDILDLSKIEAGKLALDIKSVNLLSLLSEIEQLFKTQFEQKGLVFTIDTPQKIPAGFLLDENRLRQVLINIIGNALKFTEKGYVRLSVSYELTERSEEIKTLVFKVEDTGIGIPQEAQKYIFDSFRQIEGHSARKFGGTGLGLAICKRLIELMDGEISIESEPGNGSCFTIKLHNVKQSYIHNTGQQASAFEQLQIMFTPNSVLVVDDIFSNRKMLTTLLMQRGLEVIEAEGGKEGIALAKEKLPKVILTDIRMPDINGVELAKVLKNDVTTKDIPIVAVSASVNQEEFIKGVGQIFDSVVNKPINVRELFESLMIYLPYSSKTLKPIQEITESSLSKLIREVNASLEDEIVKRIKDTCGDLFKTEGTVNINTIKIDAKHLGDLGEAYHIPELSKVGTLLEEYCDSFDIEKIKILLSLLRESLDESC